MEEHDGYWREVAEYIAACDPDTLRWLLDLAAEGLRLREAKE